MIGKCLTPEVRINLMRSNDALVDLIGTLTGEGCEEMRLGAAQTLKSGIGSLLADEPYEGRSQEVADNISKAFVALRFGDETITPGRMAYEEYYRDDYPGEHENVVPWKDVKEKEKWEKVAMVVLNPELHSWERGQAAYHAQGGTFPLQDEKYDTRSDWSQVAEVVYLTFQLVGDGWDIRVGPLGQSWVSSRNRSGNSDTIDEQMPKPGRVLWIAEWQFEVKKVSWHGADEVTVTMELERVHDAS